MRFKGTAGLTRMENIANGAVVKNHDLAKVGLYLSKILDVGPITERAVLPIISSREVLALYLQPVDNRIGILLDRGREYN